MNGALLLVAEPLLCATALALLRPLRARIIVNAIGAGLLFLLACALPWLAPLDAPQLHLVLLNCFVAMTTSWYGAEAQPRRYHAAWQVFVGATLFALLVETAVLTWLALVIAVGAAAVMLGEVRATPRFLLLCGIGSMLALLGLLLMRVAPDAASVCVLVGFGAMAGLVPLHAWLAGVAAEAPASGALLVTVLLANVPLLVFLRTGMPPALLMAFGLASLLAGAVLLFSRTNWVSAVAFAGMAQLGMITFAIGLGGVAAPRCIVLLALVRAAVLQSGGAVPALLALAVLPLFVFWMVAGPAVATSAWLLLPLGIGAVLTGRGVLAHAPEPVPLTQLQSAPMWLQLAVAAALAVATVR